MVEKEFQQLRFDVSENIRLHPQKPGIGTLLELDLFPDVECKDEGKQLKIEGFLRLNGVYVGEEQKGEQLSEDEWEEISYVIPVEITLPADRAEFEHISAEVESFDYNIVSPYELQITAILLIDGILPEIEEEDLEKVDSDERIHEEPAFSAEPVMLASLSEEEEEREPILQQEKKIERKEEKNNPPQAQHRLAEQHESEQSQSFESREDNQDASFPFHPLLKQSKEKGQEQEKEEGTPASLVKGDESLKIDEIDEEQTEPIHETEGNEKHENVLADDQEEEAVEQKRKSPEWIDWLVRSREERYEPMRMVIVQRPQPLDHLADQYQVSKDQLIEANQLKTDFIDEGEILYIPKERQSEAKGL